MPGFRNFIHQAHSRGVKLGIDTNRTEIGIRRVLNFFRLPDYFSPIMSSDDCAPKPNPAGAERICAAWSANPKQVIFIGDSENDKEAATGADVIFVAFGNSALTGDIKVSTYAKLEQILWDGADN